MEAHAHPQHHWQNPLNVICQRMVLPQGGRGGGSSVLGTQGSGALHHRSGTLAAVLDEVKMVVQLPAR